MKKLLHLYNLGHNPFPHIGKGGLGYHLPQYRLKGQGAEFHNGIISDSGPSTGDFLVDQYGNEIGHMEYDEDEDGYDATPVFNDKKVQSIYDLGYTMDIFKHDFNPIEDIEDPYIQERNKDIGYDDMDESEPFESNYEDLESKDEMIDKTLESILTKMTSENTEISNKQEKELESYLKKLSSHDIYTQKNNTINKVKFNSAYQSKFSKEIKDLINLTFGMNKEKIDKLIDKISLTIYGIDANVLLKEKEEEEVKVKKDPDYEPFEYKYLTDKEINKIKETELEDDNENDNHEETQDTFNDLNDIAQSDPSSILMPEKIRSYSEETI